MNIKALAAELIGTFWLVLGGCGAAVLAADFGVGGNGTSLGIGFLGVSLAFGLTVVTGAYAIGHVSGGHFNPAITLGLVAGGRFEAKNAPAYIGCQVVGGLLGATVIYGIASGQPGWEIGEGAGVFASNGYGDFSPGGYSLAAAFLAEVVLTAVFLVIIMGATSKKAAPAMAGLTIGADAHADPPRLDPGHQHQRQPGALDLAGDLRRQRPARPALAVLGGSDHRCACSGALIHRYVVGDPEDLLESEEIAQGEETLR